MDAKLIESLKTNLDLYRLDSAKIVSKEDKEDLDRIIKISESLIDAIEKGDMKIAKVKLGGFSRSVSDAYCIQPPSFKALAKDISRIKSVVI